MSAFTIDLSEELKKQFDSLSESFRLSKKDFLVIAITFFLFLSEKGILAQIQNMALSQNKPLTDMILEFLKLKMGGR